MSSNPSMVRENFEPVTFPEYRKRYIRNQSQIIATASYFPDKVVTNQDIIEANRLPVTDVVIRKTLGVENRRVVETGITDSDLLVEAAKRCLKQADIHVNQLSKILVTKFIGDRILPMTASLVQRKLGAQVSMHAVDIEGGINSFLHAIDLATRYISTTADEEQFILILSGGVHNLPVSKTDPRLAFLFGDGAAAVLLTGSVDPHFLAMYTYTNYQIFNAAGSKKLRMNQQISQLIYEEGHYELLYDLYQMGNWKDTAEHYLQAAQVTRDRLLQESQLSMDEIDLVLVTENNKRLRDLTLETLAIPENKSLSMIKEYANTMSAMLPILLDTAYKKHLVQPGSNIMFISHGEGASGGGMIYQI
jgi:3-oxoacyl-[acyl-carrier-protein] synthase-3